MEGQRKIAGWLIQEALRRGERLSRSDAEALVMAMDEDERKAHLVVMALEPQAEVPTGGMITIMGGVGGAIQGAGGAGGSVSMTGGKRRMR